MWGFYIAKPTKGNRIPSDKRLITDNEVIGMFKQLLKKRCIAGECTSLYFTGENGEVIFEADTKGSLQKEICDEVHQNREEVKKRKKHE